MKYIRTKDNVYQVVNLGKGKMICVLNNGHEEWIPRNWIIESGEHIEELCDWFVLRYRNDKGEYLIDRVDRLGFGMSKAELDEHDFYISVNGIKYFAVLYGAIWTEWGLKYVAKMNEKGELCLL